MKKTTILSVLFPVFLLLAFSSKGQCPSSSDPAVHVLQKGETLYRLSKVYGTTVEQLYSWNNLRSTDVLPLCAKIRVKAPSGGSQAPAPAPAPAPTTTPKDTRTEVETHVARAGETVESIAAIYGYTADRFREFNKLSYYDRVSPGQVLKASHCSCPTSSTTGTTYPPYNPGGSTSTNTGSGNTGSTSTPPPSSTANYMTREEVSMLDEINLVRSNPAGYIRYIEEYIRDLQTNGSFGNSIGTAFELIDELKKMQPLRVLQPTECIYTAARKHGQDEQRRGRTGHDGSDGSWPWDRVLRECKSMTEGNENLVGGPANVRRAVILLLVDEGIPNRGHRRTLLNPDWKYAACFNAGTVGDMPNCWVQNFGY